MDTLGEYEQAHIVACGLNALIERAINKLQAFAAFRDAYPQRANLSDNDDWYALAHSALLENLLMDVASMIDRAKYRNDSNCNFKELKYVLTNLSIETHRYQGVICEIDHFLQTYADVVPEILRNKVLAHKDLEELFCWKDYKIDMVKITRFLIEGHNIVDDVLELAVGARPKLPDLDSIKERYERSLQVPLIVSNKLGENDG